MGFAIRSESEIIYHYLSLVRRNDNAYFSFNWKSLSSNTNTFTLNTVRRRHEKKDTWETAITVNFSLVLGSTFPPLRSLVPG